MSLRSLRRWAFLAAILASFAIAGSIAYAIVTDGPSIGLGITLAVVFGVLLTLSGIRR